MNEQNFSDVKKQARKSGQSDPKIANQQAVNDETQLPVEELSEEELDEATGGTTPLALSLQITISISATATPPSPPAPPTYK